MRRPRHHPPSRRAGGRRTRRGPRADLRLHRRRRSGVAGRQRPWPAAAGPGRARRQGLRDHHHPRGEREERARLDGDRLRDQGRGRHRGRASRTRPARRSRASCSPTARPGCPRARWTTARPTRRRSRSPATTASPRPRRAPSRPWPSPASTVAVSSFLGDDAVVGVGMPMIVQFGRAIPEDYRDDVQKRMTVQTTPAQAGIWHWSAPPRSTTGRRSSGRPAPRSTTSCRPAACRWAAGGTAATTSPSTSRSARRWS